jgi:hypothetical protein
MKSDGSLFESSELDSIYKFLMAVQVNGVSVEDAPFPKKLVSKT